MSTEPAIPERPSMECSPSKPPASMSAPPEGTLEDGWATLTINGIEFPVKPESISFEQPVDKSDILSLVTHPMLADTMDIVIRIRAAREGVTVHYQRRDPK